MRRQCIRHSAALAPHPESAPRDPESCRRAPDPAVSPGSCRAAGAVLDCSDGLPPRHPALARSSRSITNRPDCEGHVIAYATAMTTIRYRWIAIALGLLAMVSPAAAGQTRTGPARRPNVLLIMADDLNDDIGTFGHPLVKTPNLDRLAARGVRFDRAYTQFPLCSPSRVSLLTGPAAGHDGGPRSADRLPHGPSRTSSRCRRCSSATATWRRVSARSTTTAIPGRSARSGLDDPASWDRGRQPARHRQGRGEPMLTNFTPERGLGSALAYYASPAADEDAHRRQGRRRDDRAAREAQGPAVLPRRRLLPAALPLHRAREVLRPLSARHDCARPRRPRGARRAARRPGSRTRRTGASTNSTQRETLRAYYASISFLDANVGRVLDALERLRPRRQHHRGVRQRPRVSPGRPWAMDEADAVRAFHARAADHRRPRRHGEGAREPARSSSSSTSTRRSRRLPACAAGGLHGRSLVPLLKDAGATWDHPALTQVRRGPAERTSWDTPSAPRWRYTEWDGGARGAELYDEVDDPAESDNLAAGPARMQRVAEMQGLLRRLAGN